MKILHLYSDWKWTGPAEPVLQMCQAMQDRGHEVLIAHSSSPPLEAAIRRTLDSKLAETLPPDALLEDALRRSVGYKVAEMGLCNTREFALDRYLNIRKTLYDFRRLPTFLREQKFDVVHMHLDHDHAEGGFCARRLGKRAPVLVRTLHKRDVLPKTFLYRWLLRRYTDGWLTFTDGFRQEYIRRFDLPAERVGVQPMTVNLDLFRPDRPVKDIRGELGVGPDTPLIGIVGRYQKYRRMDIFMEAASLVVKERPDVRFVVIGRSSQIQKTVVEPAERLGIRDKVILAGYRMEDYPDSVAALDIFSLLMPGFDGTARALREAMALAKPCVVPEFGMLPEIVPHGRAGLVVRREDPAALADGWLQLLRDRELRLKLGEGARAEALARFQIAQLGPELEAFYGRLLASRK